jgi:protein SCO1/2
MRYISFLLAAALLFSSCQNKAGSVNAPASATAKRYQLKGKVISVDKAAKKATIEHDKVEGYMDAMTMAFPIHADWVWDDLNPGSEITADLVVDNAAKEPFWLENVGIIAVPQPGQSPLPLNQNFAQIGKAAPDFALTNQDGKRVTLKDFRGKALAITFIYAKCPLPDYCIRMSTNFSDLANQLAENTELKDKIRLLSISFDPANDTPAKLREYGLGYMGPGAKGDFTIWQLAVGKDQEVRKIADFFGLRYEVDPTNKAQISHSLRTVVIGPDGKVAKIFPGNEWTPGELLRELEATLDNHK